MKSLRHKAAQPSVGNVTSTEHRNYSNFLHVQKLSSHLPSIKRYKNSKALAIARWPIFVLLAAFVVANFALVFYPKDTAMPFTSIADLPVGRQSEANITEQLNTLGDKLVLSLSTQNSDTEVPFKDLGVVLDSTATTEAALKHRSSWLPVKSAWRAWRSEPIEPIFKIDDTEFEKAASELVTSLGKKAEDAEVVIDEAGEISVKKAVTGYSYTTSDIKQEFLQNLSLNSESVSLNPQPVEPKITTAKAQVAVDNYRAISTNNITLQALGSSTSPSLQERQKWVTLNNDPEKGEISVEFDTFAIAGYLTSFANSTDVQPVNVEVTTVDGVEQSRSEGKDGKAIDREKSVDVIIRYIENQTAGTIELPTVTTKPQIFYVKKYSQTNAGLAKLVDNWLQTQTADYGIVIQELGGDQRSASHQPNKLFVTASTYKMFLAYTILKEVDEGNIKLTDKAGYSDWTVAACIQEMIRISTNFCAVPLGEKIGWAKATSVVQAAGFTSTTLNNYTATGVLSGHKWSHARDEADFLIQLNAGQLLSSSSTNLLLNHMKLQKWKGAIPAGLAPGVVSADKVGFLDTYRHDVAIVYAPNGTYILTVMSQWGTEYTISTLSEEVYEYFSQQ